MTLLGLGKIRLGQILVALGCIALSAHAQLDGGDATQLLSQDRELVANGFQRSDAALSISTITEADEVAKDGNLATRELATTDEYVTTNGYSVKNVKDTGNKLAITLQLNDYSGDVVYGDDIKEVLVEVTKTLKNTIRIKISDKKNKRWEVPTSLYSKGALGEDAYSKSSWPSNSAFEFSYQKNPFTFKVTRRSDNYVVFDSSKLSLVLKDQYLQIATAVGSDLSIYGIGESSHENIRLNVGDKHTLWARDQFSLDANVNLYGSHPFYFGLTEKGRAHGVLLLNSNGMDVTLDSDKLVYQTLGGVLDFHIVEGPTPADVVSQYTTLIGRPKLMPYWSYGFHQCRWGYNSTEALRDVVTGYADNNIPLDTIWADIDHMSKFYAFTLDPDNFKAADMQNFLSEIHANGQHFIPILDPGIADDVTYPTYTRGLEMDVFIKDTTGKPYLGQVWPGPTVFSDYLHPNASSYWAGEIQNFHNTLPFDGLWIDMNELANFCPGNTCSRVEGTTCPLTGSISNMVTCCLKCTDDGNKYDHPPFAINNYNSKADIFLKTISASALQYGGVRQYDAHNLYGFSMGIVTNAAQEQFGKRSFVLSRSTFPGAGAHVAHWTGDNGASWNDLQYSIPTILNFGLFGIPMIGADICGFIGDTNEELCARWTALGSFYPFARNHNNYGNIPHETYVWESVAEIGRKFIGMRYRLLPYFYTLGYNAHVTGTPIARALFFEFPADNNARNSPAADRQFMIGSGLLVTPVLTEGATSVTGYVPAGTWYDLFDYTKLVSKGQNNTWNVNLDDMPVLIRGGNILPLHQPALTTATARETPFDLIVALDSTGKASGQLYLDDGVAINPEGSSSVVQFTVGSSTFLSGALTNKYKNAKSFAKVTVLGVTKKPSIVLANLLKPITSFTYDSDKQTLVIDLTKANYKVTDPLSIKWF